MIWVGGKAGALEYDGRCWVSAGLLDIGQEVIHTGGSSLQLFCWSRAGPYTCRAPAGDSWGLQDHPGYVGCFWCHSLAFRMSSFNSGPVSTKGSLCACWLVTTRPPQLSWTEVAAPGPHSSGKTSVLLPGLLQHPGQWQCL